MQRLCLLMVLLAVLVPRTALGCGLAYRGYAETVAEEALIVWNPATKVEHFIRRAQFSTEDKDIGFLVPTPSVPELGEIDQGIFARLHAEIQPREETQYLVAPSLPLWLALPNLFEPIDRAKASNPGNVQLLQQTHVAGYQASVLKGDKASAIMAWLKQNGYPVRPSLKAWLEPYLRKHWVITAFRLAKSDGQPELNFKALDMRFVTERPFYPYREPEEAEAAPEQKNKHPKRSLRIHFLGPGPANGQFGPVSGTVRDGDEQLRSLALEGHAPKLYSAPLDPAKRQHLLAGSLAEADLPAESWLTSWIDLSETRFDAFADLPEELSELYFYTAKGEAYLPSYTRTRQLMIPLDLILGGAGLIVWLRRRQRKKNRTSLWRQRLRAV